MVFVKCKNCAHPLAKKGVQIGGVRRYRSGPARPPHSKSEGGPQGALLEEGIGDPHLRLKDHPPCGSYAVDGADSDVYDEEGE